MLNTFNHDAHKYFLPRYSLFVALSFFMVLFSASINAQNNNSSDSTKSQVSYNQQGSTKLERDSSQVHHNVEEATDIASDRGIFILSADRKLQLRILGSVRANFNYTDQDMLDHQTFNPFEVPTNFDNLTPNFFAGLEQTRLGFEVTRHTKNQQDIFIRIEGDFNNSSSSFRIRHAYGQYRNLLVGQTWSLFSNVNYLSAFVSNKGPVGRIGSRTPQIRYSWSFQTNMILSGAIEYAFENSNIPDSLGTALQVIPDFTGRYVFAKDKYTLRVAGIIRTLSGRTDSSDISYSIGFGGSFAAKSKLKKNGEIYFSVTYGIAISNYIDTWTGQNQDLAFNEATQTFEGLVSLSGYIAYSHELPKNFSASLGIGVGKINNRDYQPNISFNKSYNALLSLFWVPLEGARLGLEYANGQRLDKDGNRGIANRVSLILYYDF